jgi:hypothetical protein
MEYNAKKIEGQGNRDKTAPRCTSVLGVMEYWSDGVMEKIFFLRYYEIIEPPGLPGLKIF